MYIIYSIDNLEGKKISVQNGPKFMNSMRSTVSSYFRGSKDDLETRLYRSLLHYNKIPQGTTRVAPCELLMKRILRSRIDVVKPNLKNKVENNQLEMKTRKDTKAAHRSFYAGDHIYARNFIGTTKWLPGVIENVLAPLTFRIKLKDGRIWRRHRDHIKLRYTDETDTEGNETAIQDSKFQSVPELVPPQVSGVNSKETGIMDSTVDTRTVDQSTSVSSVEQIPKSPGVVESPRIKPVSRSGRIIKKPEKLNETLRTDSTSFRIFMQRRPSSLQVKCYPLVFLVHWIYPFGIFILLDYCVCNSILFKCLCCYHRKCSSHFKCSK